jgi:hypothetical protein
LAIMAISPFIFGLRIGNGMKSGYYEQNGRYYTDV